MPEPQAQKKAPQDFEIPWSLIQIGQTDRYITAHKISEKELTYSKGGDMVDLERLFILKYDDSTPDDDIDDADEDYLF